MKDLEYKYSKIEKKYIFDQKSIKYMKRLARLLFYFPLFDIIRKINFYKQLYNLDKTWFYFKINHCCDFGLSTFKIFLIVK